MHVPTAVVRAAHHVLPVMASGLVLLLAAAALPDLAGLALVAVVTTIALLLQGGIGEGLACRLLTGGRFPTVAEAALLAGATTLARRTGLGPPAVQLRVQPSDVGVVPYAWGAGIVVVPRGLVVALRDGRVSPAEAAAGLCHAGATCRAGLSTSTAALTLWCLPWTLAAGFLTGLRRGIKASPLLELAWRCRFVVPSVAVVQLSNDGHLPMAAVAAGIAAATYAQPALARWCSARVATTGDREVLARSSFCRSWAARCERSSVTRGAGSPIDRLEDRVLGSTRRSPPLRRSGQSAPRFLPHAGAAPSAGVQPWFHVRR